MFPIIPDGEKTVQNKPKKTWKLGLEVPELYRLEVEEESYVYYKRLPKPKSVVQKDSGKKMTEQALVNLLTKEWAVGEHANNAFESDFKLYWSAGDADNDFNPWRSCPADPSAEGTVTAGNRRLGFPGRCSPSSRSRARSWRNAS